jgi:hypothetical protein
VVSSENALCISAHHMFVVLFLTTELLLSGFSDGLSSRLHTYVLRLLLPAVVAARTTRRFACLDYILQS